MKRNRLARIENDGPGALDISSLVDICFLLLIYFIVTTTIVPAERDLPMGPPSDQPDKIEPIDIEPLEISINALGEVYINEGAQLLPLDMDSSVRDLPLLEDRLRIYRQAATAMNEKCLVVIVADGEVKHQRVVDVLNALAGMEIKNVSFRDRADK